MKNHWLVLGALAFAQIASAEVAVQFPNAQAAAVRAAIGPSESLRYSVQYESFSVARVSDAAFARLAAAGLSFENISASDRIQFGTMNFDPVRDQLPFASAGAGLKLVQFQAQAKSAWLDALKSQGLALLQAYPGNSFLIWSDAGKAQGLANDPNVRWVGDFGAHLKIDRTLDPSLKGRTGLIENVIAHVYAGDLPQTIKLLSAAGAQIISSAPAQPDKQLYDVVFKTNDAQLTQLALISKVIMLSYSSPQGYFEDEMSSQIVAGNTTADGLGVVGPGYLSFLNNLGWTGAGVTWAVTDSGVDLTHPEFVGKIAGGYTYPGCPAGSGLGDDNSGGGHGTHVAGIIAGAGTLNILDAGGFNYGIGVAPGARIFAQNPICVGSVPWPPVGGWQETSKRAILGGAIGTNNSWTSGEGTNAGYPTARARTTLWCAMAILIRQPSMMLL